jgi:hypothetical protein
MLYKLEGTNGVSLGDKAGVDGVVPSAKKRYPKSSKNMSSRLKMR